MFYIVTILNESGDRQKFPQKKFITPKMSKNKCPKAKFQKEQKCHEYFIYQAKPKGYKTRQYRFASFSKRRHRWDVPGLSFQQYNEVFQSWIFLKCLAVGNCVFLIFSRWIFFFKFLSVGFEPLISPLRSSRVLKVIKMNKKLL